ncbi:hypothetical protein LAZ67_4000271 [Cordylochernes scorpioides]|uniref:Histone-lysine N-methyltransferase SETMAR n=1 Tax=Cordylochernes scorpioides TaxID=51811 RepID=A0ABY6KE92_9ARAC|nr:hypothetical protein LAZ67_4000271 [Cordylochernes scorpioides]
MEAPLKDCTTLEQRAVIRFLNAEADNLNISYGTVHTIIKEQLQFRKICCRWIPHFLNLDQKLNRIRVSKALLKRYEEEGDHYLDQIVTGDESWCYHYDSSTKRASMEWKRGDSPRQKKKSGLNVRPSRPSPLWLFPLWTTKKELKGKRFDSDEDVQKVVQDFFHTLPKSAYKEGPRHEVRRSGRPSVRWEDHRTKTCGEKTGETISEMGRSQDM